MEKRELAVVVANANKNVNAIETIDEFYQKGYEAGKKLQLLFKNDK